MRVCGSVGMTLLTCRMNYPTGSESVPTHSKIAGITGLKSAKRVAEIERGSAATAYELRLIAAAFGLDVQQLFAVANKEVQSEKTV